MTAEPRLFSGTDAAAYCSVTLTTFSKWVAIGIMPRPIPGTRRWDRKAIDLALDKASGIETPTAPDDPYLTWKREQAVAEDDCPLQKWVRENEARQRTSD